MKTTVYIDGYNFYFGLLRNTRYKWLDVVSLVKNICYVQDPIVDVNVVKFFTAPVITRVATQGDTALHSQDCYHKALTATHPDTLKIINGFHILEKGFPPKYQNPIIKNDRVEVWRLEEKQTDVNIALQMYRDAAKQSCSQVVLVSSDSDLEPALALLREDFPNLRIGLILPRKHPKGAKNRPANERLTRLADWTRSYVQEEELKRFQFPSKVPTRKKAAVKPEYW